MSTSNQTLFRTNHFEYRQWDRKIPEHVINYVEKRFRPINCKKNILIISRRTLQKLHLNVKKELFLVIKDKVIITGFFEDISSYIAQNIKSTTYIIFNDNE